MGRRLSRAPGDWYAAAKLIDVGIAGLANAEPPLPILGMLHLPAGECDVFNGDATSGVARTQTGLEIDLTRRDMTR